MEFGRKITRQTIISLDVAFSTRSGTMYTVCYEIKDFGEILPELEIALGRLSDDLIGNGLLWI